MNPIDRETEEHGPSTEEPTEMFTVQSTHPSGPQPDGSFIMRDNDNEIDEAYRRAAERRDAAKAAQAANATAQNDGAPDEKP